jgi:hypothetical protein
MSNSTHGKSYNKRESIISQVGSNLPADILEIFNDYNKRVESDGKRDVGLTARKVLERLNGYGKLANLIHNLTNKSYSKEVLKLKRAAFIDEAGSMEIVKKGGRPTVRYYKKPIIVDSKPYFLTNDWFTPTELAPGQANNLKGLYDLVNGVF